MLAKSGSNRIYIDFNTSGDASPSTRGTIYKSASGLRLFVKGSGYSDSFKAKHPDAHTITATVDGNTPPNPNGPMSFVVRTRYKRGSGSCQVTCRDHAPDHEQVST